MLTERMVTQAAFDALLLEVNVTPKPGLVDRINSGAHRDMDLSHFETSAAAIAPHLGRLYRLGSETAGIAFEDALPRLREQGRLAEEDMLAATGGVNTHKGAIFSMGLLCAALGRLERQQANSTPEAVCVTAGAYVKGICQAELGAASATHGERMYLRYGAGGVRAEAESGFFHLRSVALPALMWSREQGLSSNDACLYTLLALMAQVPDTNVLNRAGEAGMAYVRETAGVALGQVQAEPKRLSALLTRMDEDFIKRNISPGGCADLLACGVFLNSIDALR